MRASVILTSLTDGIDPPTRRIELDQKYTTIQIGRSSKSSWKNFTCSEDNAWINSPVMSRDHAILSLNLDDECVELKDVGSMHGSRVNQQPVQSHTPHPLVSGDILTFGIEVRRNSSVFPPCSFRVDLTLSKYPSSSTFSVPDASDDEMSHAAESDDESIIFSPAPPAIDLTSDLYEDVNERPGGKASSPVMIESDVESDDDSVLEYQPAEATKALTVESPQADVLRATVEDAATELTRDLSLAEEIEPLLEAIAEDELDANRAPSTLYSELDTTPEDASFSELSEEDAQSTVSEATDHPSSYPQEIPENPENWAHVTLNREPSPSDAALVKSTVVPRVSAPNPTVQLPNIPAFGQHLPTTSPAIRAAGKNEFFEAWKANWELLRTHEQSFVQLPPIKSSNDAVVATPQWTRPQSPPVDIDTAFQEPLPETHEAVVPSVSNDWLRSVFGQPEFDTLESDAHVDIAKPPTPTSLAAESESTPSKKRRHDDISDGVEEEVLTWCSPMDAQHHADTAPAFNTVAPPAPLSPVIANQTEDRPRSAKRLRRVEAIGYALLGGAAFGAGVFTFLAATAPDFL